MAIGKIALQANGTRIYEITAEDGAVVIVAIGKEVYNSHYDRTVDVYDALVTMAGGLVVAIGGYNGI